MKKINCLIASLVFCCLFDQQLVAYETDSLLIRLEKDTNTEFGVNLIFENTSNDTLAVFGRFKNFEFASTLSGTGIDIALFCDEKPFGIKWGDAPPKHFTLEKELIIIPPHSSKKYLFKLRKFHHFQGDDVEYGVSFYIHCFYARYKINEDQKEMSVRTNYVVLKEKQDVKGYEK